MPSVCLARTKLRGHGCSTGFGSRSPSSRGRRRIASCQQVFLSLGAGASTKWGSVRVLSSKQPDFLRGSCISVARCVMLFTCAAWGEKLAASCPRSGRQARSASIRPTKHIGHDRFRFDVLTFGVEGPVGTGAHGSDGGPPLAIVLQCAKYASGAVLGKAELASAAGFQIPWAALGVEYTVP